MHAQKFDIPGEADQKKPNGQNIQVNRSAKSARAVAFFNDCDAFASMSAGRYFKITTAAIKSVDTNHLILGARFAIVPSRAVIAAAAPSLDVISCNCYDARGPSFALDAYAPFKKPVIIGEFAFRAQDSGLPNTHGAGSVVATQKDRANGFESYVRSGLAHPNLVGYNWFEHADEPKERTL